MRQAVIDLDWLNEEYNKYRDISKNSLCPITKSVALAIASILSVVESNCIEIVSSTLEKPTQEIKN